MKKGLVLILIFVFAFVSAACGEGESLPSASDAAAVQSASASAVLPPAKNESGAQNSVDRLGQPKHISGVLYRGMLPSLRGELRGGSGSDLP